MKFPLEIFFGSIFPPEVLFQWGNCNSLSNPNDGLQCFLCKISGHPLQPLYPSWNSLSQTSCLKLDGVSKVHRKKMHLKSCYLSTKLLTVWFKVIWQIVYVESHNSAVTTKFNWIFHVYTEK